MKSSLDNISISIYRSINKNKIALDRGRTDDLVVNSHTLYLLSYKGKKKCAKQGSNLRILR